MAQFKAHKGFHFSDSGRPWAHFKARHQAGVGTVYELETSDPALIERLEAVAAEHPEYGIQRLPEAAGEPDSDNSGESLEEQGSGEDSGDAAPARGGRGKSGA